MVRLERAVTVTSRWFNYAACLAVVVMMLLSCADVALRLFGAPIPGTYEMVGFLGTVIISFALAYTSIQRGHVAVELIFDKLPPRVQCFVEAAGNLTGAALFGLMAWQSLAYGTDLRHSGGVSLTLQLPVYPFAYGIALGSGMPALVLLIDFIRSFIIGLIILVYLVLGCLMDSLAMIVLTIPIFFPVVTTLGYDPIWFGVIIVLVTEMGVITPPVGINVYVVAGVARDVPLHIIFKGATHLLMALLVTAALLILFPQIATFLPSLMK